MIDRRQGSALVGEPVVREHWPVVIRGGILVLGVLSSWGLALTALHLI